VQPGSSGNASAIARIIGIPSAVTWRAAASRYGISRIFSRVNVRRTSTASSSNSHGTR
jgi:hypothetical protein